MRIRSVLSVHPDPEGRRIAFLRTEPRLDEDEEPGPAYTRLHMVDAQSGDERLLIGGKRRVTGVSWRPDGYWITFLDKRKGDEHPEIYALPMEGGESFRLTSTENGVLSYRWRADSTAIAYTSAEKPSEARAAARKMGFKQHIVDESWDHVSLHLWDQEKESSQRLTEGVSVTSFEWSADGKHLAAAIAPRSLIDDRFMFARLHLIDPSNRSVTRLGDNPGKLGAFAWSPDSARLAYVSAADRNDPHAGMLYVMDISSGEVMGLTEGFEGMVHSVQWLNPQRIRSRLSEGISTSVADFDLSEGTWTNRTPDGPALGSVLTSSNGRLLAAVGSRPDHPAEVYRFDAGWHRLTKSNPWLEEVELGTQEVVEFAARDGLKIQGLLLYPLDYEDGKRYPLVIVVHGGPESHFSNGWLSSYGRWGQLLSARGYFSWYPNYRSSTGRGVDFAKKDHGDPMGAEFEDHLDAIRHFDARGLIDPKRVGIGGGSYGGYTAAWAATRHSGHFAAAVSFVPFVDIVTKWYTTDIPWEFYYVHYQEKWPHQQTDFLRERSPLSYAVSAEHRFCS